jgi:hypothetical protein
MCRKFCFTIHAHMSELGVWSVVDFVAKIGKVQATRAVLLYCDIDLILILTRLVQRQEVGHQAEWAGSTNRHGIRIGLCWPTDIRETSNDLCMCTLWLFEEGIISPLIIRTKDNQQNADEDTDQAADHAAHRRRRHGVCKSTVCLQEELTGQDKADV